MALCCFTSRQMGFSRRVAQVKRVSKCFASWNQQIIFRILLKGTTWAESAQTANENRNRRIANEEHKLKRCIGKFHYTILQFQINFTLIFSLYPGDLIPFVRKPLFLIVDSDNSWVFQSIPPLFGQPLVILMSPQDVPSQYQGWFKVIVRETWMTFHFPL